MLLRSVVPTLVLAALAVCWSDARAEIIVFRNGRTMQGSVVRVGDKLRIELKPGAVVVVGRDQVKEIRPGTWGDEYARRVALLKPADGDAGARYQLAVWCVSKGLRKAYEVELQAVLRADPQHRGALSRIESLRARREAARARAKAGVQKPAVVVGSGPFAFRSDHISVRVDGSVGQARRVAEAGERAVKDFSRLTGVGLDDRRLRSFRVSVRLYSRREEFKKVAKKYGGSGLGFFSYLDSSCHVQDVSGYGGRANYHTVRHEVGHGLVWKVFRVASRTPWVHEAMATLLEGDGEDAVSPWRLRYVSWKANDVNLSVPALLSSRFRSRTQGANLLSYARVWSFAHFIFHQEDDARKKTFLKFLVECAGWKTDINRVFKRHFPEKDWNELEADWRSHVNDLIVKHLPKSYRVTVPAPARILDNYRRQIRSPRRDAWVGVTGEPQATVKPAAVKPAVVKPAEQRRGGAAEARPQSYPDAPRPVPAQQPVKRTRSGGTLGALLPKVGRVNAGTVFDVRPMVHANRRYITLGIRATFTKIKVHIDPEE
jgi:hypothetical protein